ncbi:hypothetical protein NL676_037387 [Syzygium grande]|nr:hypothetical protein NL676_037387 [Syzygium grande]
MLPFFGDIMVLLGVFGCIPLDFTLPMVFYNVDLQALKRSFMFWANTTTSSCHWCWWASQALALVSR